MRKFAIGLVLAAMMVFSLSADETLKERHVNNSYEGQATVFLNYTPGPEPDGCDYSVIWWMDDGSDVLNIYYCPPGTSLEQAFKVWNMNRYEIESIRKLFHEEAVKDDKFGLLLLRGYIIK